MTPPPSSLPDYVATQLRTAILGGQIAAGTPLRQEDIAQQLGVSRPPVREALRLLEGEGLAVLRPRRGYVVASLDAADVVEIFGIRERLEEHAAELAAMHRTAEDIADLARLLEEMEAIEDRDLAGFAAANHAFHARIFQVAGRPRLLRMMLSLRETVERYVRVGGALSGDMTVVRAEHRAIFAAFEAGDPARLGSVSRAHVASTGRRLLAALAQHD
ncbi:GntR family transcriptional regulator [Roseomonas xinghualingensis]|uniref:GntR family transcriptional regulator n=1 Tax=Roseomonas xinghualingensis TaxID=2986475 RepID=UPI0021F217D9|nr:GntR family transcriptional regulator [Roseomonas sp. SXEYE001]MCV4208057.1 GntR family transcriptional regulator [Roseomonas sp. SXEYE001]